MVLVMGKDAVLLGKDVETQTLQNYNGTVQIVPRKNYGPGNWSKTGLALARNNFSVLLPFGTRD